MPTTPNPAHLESEGDIHIVVRRGVGHSHPKHVHLTQCTAGKTGQNLWQVRPTLGTWPAGVRLGRVSVMSTFTLCGMCVCVCVCVSVHEGGCTCVLCVHVSAPLNSCTHHNHCMNAHEFMIFATQTPSPTCTANTCQCLKAEAPKPPPCTANTCQCLRPPSSHHARPTPVNA